MWWDMATEDRDEFQDWHSHEHFPERLGIPGFLRGSRWESADGDQGFFVMYELESYATLTSDSYLARLNDPTPWSTKMMPRHRNMVRSQCRLVASHGGGLAAFVATLRVSPSTGCEDGVGAGLASLLSRLPERPGLTGAHLLRTRSPQAPQTREQQIRGGDAVADWIILLSGYESDLVRAAAGTDLSDEMLMKHDVAAPAIRGNYHLCHALTAEDRQARSAKLPVLDSAHPAHPEAQHP
jgi:hypothetical protein